MFKKISQIALSVVLLLLFASFLIHPLKAINQDLGRYFKVSEIILEEKSIPDTNLFSYTYPDYHFINTHWLGGMTFFGLSKIVGLKGLIFFKAFIILLVFALVLYIAWRLSAAKSENGFWPVFWIGLLSISVFIERTDVRPEIFSYLFLAVFLYIIYFKVHTKWLWLLPFLALLWVNVHIYFFILPALFCFFLAERIIGKKTKELKRLLFAAFLISAAVLLNPNGYEGISHLLSGLQGYGYTIVENQTPFFLWDYGYHKNTLLGFFAMSVLLLFSLGYNFKRVRVFELLSGVFLVLFGCMAVRNFPIFAVGALPIIANNFAPGWDAVSKKLKKFLGAEEEKSLKYFLTFATLAVLLVVSLANFSKTSLATTPKAKKAVDFLLEKNISGNMFNNFDVGGYLIYRLYPERKVFIDNRLLAYPKDFFQEVYIPMQKKQDIWQKYVQKYNINYVFFEHTDITPWAQKFLRMISQSSNWREVYKDNYEVIYVKK